MAGTGPHRFLLPCFLLLPGLCDGVTKPARGILGLCAAPLAPGQNQGSGQRWDETAPPHLRVSGTHRPSIQPCRILTLQAALLRAAFPASVLAQCQRPVGL